MKYLAILLVLLVGCGSDSMALDNNPYEMRFKDFCEVIAVDEIRHTIKCQDELFVVHYYFEPPDKPLEIGNSVQTEFSFEAVEDKFTLIEIYFIDMNQPEEMEDHDE